MSSFQGPKQRTEPVAITVSEFAEFGCPYCGSNSRYPFSSQGGAQSCVCLGCDQMYAVVNEGLTQVPFSLGGVKPLLVPHPRRGIPKDT